MNPSLSAQLDDEIAREDWFTTTGKNCVHCKKKLSIYEYSVNKKEWNKRMHKHYCCYVCFCEKHI